MRNNQATIFRWISIGRSDLVWEIRQQWTRACYELSHEWQESSQPAVTVAFLPGLADSGLHFSDSRPSMRTAYAALDTV
jgi:hypothetical protein